MLSLIPFINNTGSSNDLTIFIISFISSFENINALVHKAKSAGRHDPNINWIALSTAEIPADNPNRIKTVLADGVSIFSLTVNQLLLMA